MSETLKPLSDAGRANYERIFRRKPVPALPILVACHTQVQLDIFCRNHGIPRNQAIRIRGADKATGLQRGHTIYLLPDWWQGTESGMIPYLEARGHKMVSITEDEVLTGTFNQWGVQP